MYYNGVDIYKAGFLLLCMNILIAVTMEQCGNCTSHCCPPEMNKMTTEVVGRSRTKRYLSLFVQEVHILRTAPCPPIWNISLALLFFTNSKLSCNQSVFILKSCLYNYNNTISCGKQVELVKTCLVTSLCTELHDVLKVLCEMCPDKCIDPPPFNHSSITAVNNSFVKNDSEDLFYDDHYHSSGGDGPSTTTLPSSYVITDTSLNETIIKSSSLASCNTVCLSIILPLLCILFLGAVVLIICLCRQERQRKRHRRAKVRYNYEGVIRLQRVRPYSYQEEPRPKTRVHTSIVRSRSADWYQDSMARNIRFEQSKYGPAFQDRNSFKII